MTAVVICYAFMALMLYAGIINTLRRPKPKPKPKPSHPTQEETHV
ncbi:MAG: hypothetical protein OXH63_22055 [Gemmatimonadetes bacterium]|nr:hypothetical protein [Gemmatimonadota bacterium]